MTGPNSIEEYETALDEALHCDYEQTDEQVADDVSYPVDDLPEEHESTDDYWETC